MEFKDISKWFWDIESAGYKDDTTMLYMMSGFIAIASITIGTIFFLLSKRK